jgi:hypothetical protein
MEGDFLKGSSDCQSQEPMASFLVFCFDFSGSDYDLIPSISDSTP